MISNLGSRLAAFLIHSMIVCNIFKLPLLLASILWSANNVISLHVRLVTDSFLQSVLMINRCFLVRTFNSIRCLLFKTRKSERERGEMHDTLIDKNIIMTREKKRKVSTSQWYRYRYKLSMKLRGAK